MAAESLTLAEVLLGFGGKTLYTLATGFTSVGTLFFVMKVSTWGTNVFTNLHRWLGTKDRTKQSDPDTALITKQDVFDGLSSLGKISLFIILGVLIKMVANWMSLNSTANSFNKLLYSSNSITA